MHHDVQVQPPPAALLQPGPGEVRRWPAGAAEAGVEVQRSVRPRQHQPGPQEGGGGGRGGGGQGEHQQLHAEGSHRLESEGGYSQAAAAAGITPIAHTVQIYMAVNCDKK